MRLARQLPPPGQPGPATDRSEIEPVPQAPALADLGAVCDEVADWPLPGHGTTRRRFRLLGRRAREDLVLGRLVEAHADALAILAELAGPEAPGSTNATAAATPGRRWGVWAAGPAPSLRADLTTGGRWHVTGVKRWCSGATLLTDALVDAATAGGQRLFAVDLSHAGVGVGGVDWVGPGMAGADTRSVAFDGVPAQPVGAPGTYLDRPGFWAGAVGVAACWHGGSVAVARRLWDAVTDRDDTLLTVHLAAVHVAIEQNRALLEAAADLIDADPGSGHPVMARTVRHTVERNAGRVIDHVGRALGPGPLAHDRRHAQLVADLAVYVRQHHAERDLSVLGNELIERRPSWLD